MLVNLQKEMIDSSLPVVEFLVLLFISCVVLVWFDTIENVISVPFSGLIFPSVSLSNSTQNEQYSSAS